ncbi:MAG: cation-translocating P-type ATPase [Candidatus Hodarchaeota archaeon]
MSDISDAGIQKEDFYLKSIDECLNLLKTSTEGLTSGEYSNRLEVHGYNELEGKPPVPGWKKFLAQFNDFLIWILIASAIIAMIGSMVEGELPTDTIIIVAILIINAILGYYQEAEAEKAIEALKKMSAAKATVLRDDEIIEIFARELVPGDVILLETGDQVPADARIIDSNELKADEASLTGESMAVSKTADAILEEVTIGDRKNSVFSSTIITYGRGRAIVTSTGMNTEIGKIAKIISETEDELTPLAKKIDKFGKKLGWLIIIICVASFVVYLIRGEDLLLSIMVAISLAVAAIPEGLAAIITTSLALGVQRMAKKNAIVRKLPSVETLGCTTVICSDKTGTLTKNEMTIRRVFVDMEFLVVTGNGYEPVGEFTRDGDTINAKNHESLNLMGRIGVSCNNASIRMDDDLGKWVVNGDPTEAAFLTLGGKLGYSKDDHEKENRRISEVFFSSERKKMSTVDMNLSDNSFMVSMKGALEIILKDCTKILVSGEVRNITKEDIDKLTEAQLDMSNQALRVLGTAYKLLDEEDLNLDPEAVESDLIFVGLVGMIDPPREEVKGSVDKCKKAGIKTVMITGDHAATAKAIAQELSMLPENIKDGHHHIIQGIEIDGYSDTELLECDVFARVAPEHKMRIVKAYQENGDIVSMTGDGVNDAPALKKADAGVAMGITGTDVSKEAADIVLADDNFASIVAAVEEGRAIYDNMKRFINFLISCNLGEILVIFLAALLLLPTPLLAIHLLWVNLLTDGLPALAMGFEKADDDIMLKEPRPSDEPIITQRNWLSYISSGALIGFCCVFTFWLGLMVKQDVYISSEVLTEYAGTPISTDLVGSYNYFDLKALLLGPAYEIDPHQITLMLDDHGLVGDVPMMAYPRTLAFTSLVVSEMMNAYNCRSETVSVFKKSIADNWFLLGAVALTFALNLLVIYIPAAANLFGIKAINLEEWGWIILIASPRIFSEEIIKIYWKKAHPTKYVEATTFGGH